MADPSDPVDAADRADAGDSSVSIGDRGARRPRPPGLFVVGLWRDNPALVSLLGLCPLLAVSQTAVTGFALGVATLATLLSSSLLVALARRLVPDAVRIPVFVLLIATVVTAIDIGLHACLPALHARLGLFLPLIVTNCLILARAEIFASRHEPIAACMDAAGAGLGFLWVLVVLGAGRELIGTGRLLADLELLLPSGASVPALVTISEHGILLATLPPGAFMLLGVLLALHRLLGPSDRRGRS